VVQRGQFLERPTLIPIGPIVLEGLSHRGEKRPPLLVLPPLPGEGGGMDHVVCAELAWAATQAGHPSLRFNFKGVGASQGKRGEAMLDDARAAFELALDNWGSPPVVASIGASAALALRLEDAAGYCLITPPAEIDVSAPNVWVVVGAKDLPQGGSVATGRRRVIPDADRTFQKNLPMVGHAIAECLKLAETLQ
jgi:alpha/beta superfamily hydrolase